MSDAERLRALENENARLKRLVADRSISRLARWRGKRSMTTSERRVAFNTTRARHAVSEQRVCRAPGFERKAFRYTPFRRTTLAPLRAKLREPAAAYPRWGASPSFGGCSAMRCA